MTELSVDHLRMPPQAGIGNELDSGATLIVALLLTLAAHLFLIFGVAFEPPRPPPTTTPDTIDIIVVNPANQPTSTEYREPDAAGPTEESDGDSIAPTSPQRVTADEVPAPDLEEPPPLPTPPEDIDEVQAPRLETALITPEETPFDLDLNQVTTMAAPEEKETIKYQPPEPIAPVLPEPVNIPRVTAAQILASRDSEIALLSARIGARSSDFGRNQRRKAINASTREFKYANYLEAWRKKVERIGNLNYPQEAKRKGLFGNLILHVALRSNGSIETLRIVRSSGHPMLDEAAMNIVALAAPFAPFPQDIKSETDILDITRTWQFLRGNKFSW